MYKVLIVEDNPSDAKILEFILTKRKYEVLSCQDAHQAFEALQKFSIDLILLDWQLPKISGLEILKTLRKEDKYKKTPIMLISGKNEIKDVQSAIQNGANDYIIKPIDPLVLDTKLSRFFKGEIDWKLISLPASDTSKAVVTCAVEILKMSEVGVEIKSQFPLNEGMILTVNLNLLNNLQMSPLTVKVYSCEENSGNFYSKCSLVGMKESEMQKIRIYLRLLQIDEQDLAS